MGWDKEEIDLEDCSYWFVDTWVLTHKKEPLYIVGTSDRHTLKARDLDGKIRHVSVNSVNIDNPLSGFCYFKDNVRGGSDVLSVYYMSPRSSRSYKKGLYLSSKKYFVPQVVSTAEGKCLKIKEKGSSYFDFKRSKQFVHNALKKPKGNSYKSAYFNITTKQDVYGQILTKDLALIKNPLNTDQIFLCFKNKLVGICEEGLVKMPDKISFIEEELEGLHVKVA